MKRLWLGLCLLAVLLSGCIFVHTTLHKIYAPMVQQLEEAAEAALQQDWPTALDALQHAAVRWKKFHHLTAAFADHTPMDEIDSLFRELQVYAVTRENPHFSAACAQLRFLAAAVVEAHQFSWWNLL